MVESIHYETVIQRRRTNGQQRKRILLHVLEGKIVSVVDDGKTSVGKLTYVNGKDSVKIDMHSGFYVENYGPLTVHNAKRIEVESYEIYIRPKQPQSFVQ